MSKITEARQYDQDNKPINAMDMYHLSIQNKTAEFSDYINASVLSFVFQDYGYSMHHNLPDKYVDNAWTTMYEYLDKAESLYGTDSEIKFWRKFYKIILDCEDQNDQEFIEYLNQGALVACIGLLSLVDNDSYIKDSVIKLKKLVSSGKTAKDRYVFSMIENIN
ncbi:MAG: hypothetical protein QM500_10210 [Methylococcales bacterium]